MKLNLEQLKKIASAATPGPWHHDSGNGQVETEEWRIEIVNAVSNSARWEDIENRFEDKEFFKDVYDIIAKHDVHNDMDHIAAFNPSVALALIERIENLEQGTGQIEFVYNLQKRIKKLERYIKEIEEASEWYEDGGAHES